MFDFGKHFLIDTFEKWLSCCKFFPNQTADFVQPCLMHGDLDPRFVFIVAPPQQIIDCDNGFQIWQQIFPRQELGQHLADHRRAA